MNDCGVCACRSVLLGKPTLMQFIKMLFYVCSFELMHMLVFSFKKLTVFAGNLVIYHIF